MQALEHYLLQHQLIDSKNLQQAKSAAISQQTSLLHYLASKKCIAPSDLLQATQTIFQLPVIDLMQNVIEETAYLAIPFSLIEKYHLLPFKKEATCLSVAVLDPSNLSVIETIKFSTGLVVELFLVSYDQLFEKLQQLKSNNDQKHLSELNIRSNKASNSNVVAVISDQKDPVMQFINHTIEQAVERQASDIHFEIYEAFYRIRLRQDGLLHEIANPPKTIASRLITRLKVMANLNIAESRLPQDGRFQMKFSSKQAVDVRVNSCPTLNGEKIVLRLLNDAKTIRKIDELGMNKVQKKDFKKAVFRPQGLILVTGPTGSGKTVTLYAALEALNSIERNISAVEDPVEIQLPGINQVHVNTKIGLNFASALRAFLRQDPDVIMLGEIRDSETAEIAIKAAQTGHLVLSTLHTNSALEALTRLHHMGVAPHHLVGSIILVTAQRLIRKLCPYCKESYALSKELQQLFCLPPKIFKAKQCGRCCHGYLGRMAIHEVLAVNDQLIPVILQQASQSELKSKLDEAGYQTLQQLALQNVSEGVTSLEEIQRVVGL